MNKLIISLFLIFFAFNLNAEQSPNFIEGYIYSKIEDMYGCEDVKVEVDNKCIIIYSDFAEVQCENILVYLELIYPEYQIYFEPLSSYCPKKSKFEGCPRFDHPFEEQIFLPELNPFFPTLLAEPHIIGYSAGYRSADKTFKSTLPVSIGDQFSLYGIKLDPCHRLYFGIEACVWAIFEAKTKSLSLINADYYVALPFTYLSNQFSARFRVFHQSSHLGDEFLLENPRIKRLNPSMEAIDFAIAYEPLERLIFFGGYTKIIRSDESFTVRSNLYYGFNLHLNYAKIQMFQIEGIPYIASYFSHQETNHWGCDKSLAIGYEWNKCFGKKVRIYFLAHDGYSADGQFARRRSQYISFQMLYSY